MTTYDTSGANARQAMIDIFRKKDATAVDRYFAPSFMQHDPNLADKAREVIYWYFAEVTKLGVRVGVSEAEKQAVRARERA